MIRISLRYRIALATFVLTGAMAGVLLWHVQTLQVEAARAQEAAAEAVTADLLGELSCLALVRSEYGDLEHHLGRIRQNPRILRIVVADVDGRVVASTDAALLGMPLPPMHDSATSVWKTHQLANAAGRQGLLAMEVSNLELFATQRRIRAWAAALALVSMTIIALVSLLMGRALSGRLAVLEEATHRIGEGDYGVRTQMRGSDEVAAFGRTLDVMAAKIEGDIAERMRAAAALRASREKYRRLLDTIPHGIQENDTSGVITFSNRAHHRILGFADGELVGKFIWDLQGSPEEREALRRYLEFLVSKRPTPVPHLGQSVRKDGRRVDLQVDWDYLADAEDRVTGFISVITDITERKRAEAQVTHLNRLYALLSNVNQAIVRIRDRQTLLNEICRIAVEYGKFRMVLIGLVDEAASRIRVAAWHGFAGDYVDRLDLPLADSPAGRGPTATAIRQGMHVVCNDVEHDQQVAPWRDRALAHGYRSLASFPLIVLGKTIGAFNIYASEVGFFNEQEVRVLDELAADIAFAFESIEREEAQHRSEEQYRLVVENASDAIVIAQDGRLEFPNPALVNLLGCSPEAVGSTPFMHFIHPDDRQLVQDMHARHLLGQDVGDAYEFRIVAASGAPRWVHAGSVRIEWHGRPATLNFLNDTTHRKALEVQLLHAQKMEAVGQLAGGVAHDFNNMLSAIIGYGNMALMDLSAANQARDDVEQMLAAANRAADLTRSLLAFSRKQVINPRPVTIDSVIDRVQSLLRRIVGEDVVLRTVLSTSAETVLADGGQIEQMLVNLAANSRDAMPKGGQLAIETGRAQIDDEFIRQHGYGKPGTYVLITVSDTGEGMDEATRQRVFEPFFTTKEVGKGTGLGLAMIYGAVKQHGGYVNVESKRGQGTTFRIYLPVVNVAARPLANAESRAKPRGGEETVLLAEDDPAVRSLTRRILEESGYTVIAALDGQDAVEQLTKCLDRVDLLMVDVVMPRKNGKEVVEEARRMRPGIKILLTSGYPAEMIQAKGAADEGLTLLPKPASPAELLEKVREVLDGAAALT